LLLDRVADLRCENVSGASGQPIKRREALGFYMSRAEFIEFPSESKTLFLPIETIIAAL
jgi:hypothetical protein